jgi:serine/threonine protein kinase
MKDGQVKIADFGFSKNNICQKMKVGSFVGSPLYMAPQILRGEPYSSKCDVWAFGLIFYELLHKRTPWTGETSIQLVRNIEKEPLRVSPRLGPLTVDFLRHALRTEERDRMSWDEVFSHEIFCGMFEYLKQNQREIEDKLKMLMTAVRQEIDRKNISVTLLLETLQLKDELNLPQFTRFITAISPALASDDIRRIFDRLDADSSGTVEIAEIEAEMRKHFIDTSKHSSIKRTNTLPVE